MDETVDGDPGNASATKMIANGIQILCQYIAGRRLDVLARSERFELPTLGFEVRCSIQLSYERNNDFNDLETQANFLAAVVAAAS